MDMERENCNFLTITPISRDVRNKGYIDYNEQEKRTSIHGHRWCWDDSQYNKAKIGEYFAFLFFERRVVIHKIENIKPPSERLESWLPNVTQRNRQVLELSNPLKELSWREWLEHGGLLCKQVTYRKNTMLKMPPLYQMLVSMEIEKEIETTDQKDVQTQAFDS